MPSPTAPARLGIVALVVFLACSMAFAQAPPSVRPGGAVVHPTSTTREALGDVTSIPQPAFLESNTTEENPTPADSRFSLVSKFDYTFLPGGGADEMGIQDFEISAAPSAKNTVPLAGDWGPLWVAPGAAVHCWQGPESSTGTGPSAADLPGAVYDLYVDFGWRPRPYEWLFLDMQFTPGLYTDFSNDSSAAFRPRGRALAIVALSERLQFVAGAIYTNRLRTTLIPAGGVLWGPNEDTQIDLVFPAPRISRRVLTTGGTKWWAYVAGEFGGGAWAVERAEGFDDTVDYTDLRVITGLEAVTPEGHKGHVEIGYVFARRISYGSERPGSFDPAPTLMLRAGFSY